MRRRTPEAAEPVGQGEGPDDRRLRQPADRRRVEGVRRGAAHRPRGDHRRAHPARDPGPAAVPLRCRRRVPDARPECGHAVGRRRAAHPPGDADRRQPDGRALRARRAVDRPSSARQPQAAGDARPAARSGQHGHCRRARRGDDPHRRLRDRSGSGRRRAWRPGHLPGHACRPDGRSGVDYGRLSDRHAHDPDTEEPPALAQGRDRHPRRTREQPEEPRRPHTAWRVDGGDRCERLGQVHARQRHPLSITGAHAVPGGRRARRSRRDAGHGAPRQGDRDRSVADRPDAAVEPGDLHRALHLHPRSVRDDARREGARVPDRALLVQRQGRPVRGVPGRWGHRHRDALPAGRLRHVRAVQGAPVQPGDAGNQVPRAVRLPTCSS